MNESTSLEIWKRLVRDKSLNDLHLPEHDGLLDLRGLSSPGGSPSIENARLKNLDFSDSDLQGLRLFNCQFENCNFDRCKFYDLRVWSSTFLNCSFKGADLSKSVLGGVQEGRRSVYLRVDFTDADLSETVYKAAGFEKCTFRNTKLVKIDFQTSTFIDCTFEGELNDVIFYRRAQRAFEFPANEMVNVDFSKAILRHVSFRGLGLDRVRLPEDANHLRFKWYGSALDKLVAKLEKQNDPIAKKLITFLGNDRKWVIPEQEQGVINLQDVAEVAGGDAAARLVELVP